MSKNQSCNFACNFAKMNKNDEFYTRIEDVEKELSHYTEHFKDRIIYCNCDNPTYSAFWKYFHLNFSAFKLKKLISTYYNSKCDTVNRLFDIHSNNQSAYKIEYTGGNDNDIGAGIRTNLKGNGDFRSQECINILKESDIVATNPPFSLFKEYVTQLMEYGKKFIIIGHQNAIAYKNIFPYIKDNKIWLGYGFSGNVGFFMNTQYEDYAKANQHKEGMIRVSGVMWYTNIDTEKQHQNLVLYKNYTPKEYPKYDNYNAIEVSKVSEIPCDYNGVMGVPITFLTKYNPEQFIILGADESTGTGASCGLFIEGNNIKKATVNGKLKYKRIFIRRK